MWPIYYVLTTTFSFIIVYIYMHWMVVYFFDLMGQKREYDEVWFLPSKLNLYLLSEGYKYHLYKLCYIHSFTLASTNAVKGIESYYSMLQKNTVFSYFVFYLFIYKWYICSRSLWQQNVKNSISWICVSKSVKTIWIHELIFISDKISKWHVYSVYISFECMSYR